MNPTDKLADISFADLALEPIKEDIAPAVSGQPAAFHANTRSKTKTERRVLADRRVEIRFQADRRAGKDRRPKKSWEPGSNI